MITVDIYIPAMDRVYNFNLDENSKIQALIAEISDLICRKEHSSLEGDRDCFVMGSMDQKKDFNPNGTLSEYSVKNGEQLILV